MQLNGAERVEGYPEAECVSGTEPVDHVGRHGRSIDLECSAVARELKRAGADGGAGVELQLSTADRRGERCAGGADELLSAPFDGRAARQAARADELLAAVQDRHADCRAAASAVESI